MMKKLFPLLLCMIMLVSAFAVSASAAGNEPNLTVDISKTEVVENDEVVVTIGIKEMKAASVLFTLDFDTDMLTVSSITAKRNAKLDYYAYDPDADEWYEDQLGATTISTKAEAASGHIGVAFANDTEVLYYEKSDVVVVKFIAKKAGAIEFEIYESSSGTDGYKGTWIEPPQAPACEHTETKLVPNADKTHNVVCANTECGEIVKANETCTGTDDGDHTTDVKCECGNVVTAGTGHSFTTKASNQQASLADCENAAKYYVQCDYCAAVDTTKTVEVGTANGHSFTTKASNQQASPADCENAAKYYVQCDNCEAVDTIKTVEVGTANGHSFQNGLKGTQFFPGDCTTPAAYYAKCDNCDFENQEKFVTGELNSANHKGPKEYVKIDEESHKSVCYCGATLGESAHTYDETTHKCECGAIDHICADNLIHVPALKATCNSTGNLEHYKCSCGILYNDAAATNVADPALVILPIDPNNHVWGETSYNWAKVDKDKKATVKAVRTCTVHTDVVQPAAGKVTAKNVGGDCKLGEHNKIVYTATFTVDWATTQTATYVYPGQSHTHLIYTDNGDGTHHIDCECGNYPPKNNPHKYSTKTHKCTCGAIEPTGWVEKDGAWYFVYADYTYATGIARAPYFGDYDHLEGDAVFIDATEAWFVFGEDGKLDTRTQIIDGKYSDAGLIAWHPGYVEVDGEFYYFVADKTNGGNKLADGIVYATRGLEGKYLFEDGKIVDFTGVLDGLYFVNGKVAMGAGLVKLADGNIIYVRSNGELATGSYWVTAEKANGLVNGGRAYEFDANGYLVTEIAKTGIFDGKYYVEGKLTYAGLIEIDGDIYYINSKGEVVTGKYYVTKTNGMDLGTNKLYFGEDGKMLKIMNGIYEEEGKLYYYVGNRKQCGLGLVEIDGDLYYVRSSGELVTGYFFVTKTNEIEGFNTGDKCKFDEDGKLIQNFGPAKK